MKQHCLLVTVFLVLSQTNCWLFDGDKKGHKDSVVISVDTDPFKFMLKSKESRGDRWELQGIWKSKKDYPEELVGKTAHRHYILNCFKPKAQGNSRIVFHFGYKTILEVDVTSCDGAKFGNALRIREPDQGYHRISVLFKDSCKEYQVNMQTAHDNGTTECQRNAGSAEWEKIG